jgi:localization factor PodJL
MKSGVPWQESGVRREALETAREAARRAGMSIGEWLDGVILESAEADDAELGQPAARENDHYGEDFTGREDDARRSRGRHAEYDDRLDSRLGEHRDPSVGGEDPYGGYAAHHHDPHCGAAERENPPSDAHPPGRELPAPDADLLAAELEQRLPLACGQDRPAIHEGFAELNQRLDDLTRQLSQVATMSAAKSTRREPRHEEPSHQLVEVISKLDRRLDQLIAEARSSKTDIEQRVHAVGRAIADLNREQARPLATPDPPTPLDQALIEIADRQRTLDGYAPVGSGTPSTRTTIPPEGLPRARTQEFSGLEQQLRQINAQIGNLKPCGIDRAIDTLRDDLAEIGVMLQDAMPRKSVEAIEHEMRKLADRIDHSRNTGADAAVLASVERGLAEVRDALHGLAPAENLPAVDRELKQLSQKIDVLAHNGQDPAALRQLESAITGLGGIVSDVASNDALASLSDEVRALAGKVDRTAANSGSDSVLNALEERIAALADALAARNQGGESVPYQLEAVVKGLVDKIERVQLTRSDHAALGHLEDRIAKLVEKLDASDARLNHLEAIERGLAELLIQLEHQRVPTLGRAGSPPAEVDELSRDVADLRQTGKKTQESLEVVHGTLGHVVDRLAMIETDMRGNPARLAESPAIQATAVAPAAPASPKPAASTKSPLGSATPAAKTVNTATNSPPSSASPAQAPQPIEFAPAEPSKVHEAPGTERRPIDPTLPPDHPLEPGSRGSRRGNPGSPADRIAASESVLIGATPPATLDSGGKPSSSKSSNTKSSESESSGNRSNFIAAARRAAQAASREAPAKSPASGPREIASAAGKLASRVGKLGALIGGTTAIVIVLGGLQIARIFLNSPQEAQKGSAQRPSLTIVATPERPADVAIAPPADVKEAAPPVSGPAPSKPASSEPTARRQSSAFPSGAGTSGPLPGSDITIPARQATGATPPQPAANAAPPAEREITGSISPSAKPTTTPASAASTPSMYAPASAPAQQTSAISPAGSDKLPAAFAMSLRTAAGKGDAAAQYEIAQRYAEGRGVAQNLTEAAEWFERAAKHGLVPAQFRLGGLYEKGLGVKKNLETARRFYIAAGGAGNAKAMHNLAVLYVEGIDGKPDYQTAARWFHKAADYGVVDSQYNLAILYARGIGVEQNLAEAYKWFALAARDGDADSVKKRDDLAARLDRHSLDAAAQAIQAWAAQQQPEAAVEVKTPPGGWDQAAAPPIVPPKRKPPVVGPKLDLAIPRLDQ